jgi:hypothetical protein
MRSVINPAAPPMRYHAAISGYVTDTVADRPSCKELFCIPLPTILRVGLPHMDDIGRSEGWIDVA